MAQVIIAPGKYVQGSGEMKRLATYIAPLGKKALCLVSASGLKRNQATIDASFAETEGEVVYEVFNGECCRTEIDRIIEVCKANDIDVIIGVGGGKILDTSKAVGYYHHIPVAIVPTIASTDAPCSALSVIYTEDGVFESYLFLPQNPNVVLVDTDVVVKAPTRLLVSGMGDALATYFEARACEASGAASCAGGTPTKAAIALAKLCYDTLIEKGELAKYAAEQHVCTKAVEKIIEANTFLSGIGFESGGLAGAHAIHNGFTVLPQCHHMYHGEKVAFGTIVQLILEDVPEEELMEVMDFCVAVGLPVTLGELGITEVKPEEIMAVAEAAAAETDTIHNMPFPVTAEDVYNAILTADAIGKDML
ncbi:MAG: glycerol dehydrogenase [Lachnospiraceae bacterium]|nr:glycerol dehydrogenase [Lachnospiraceae bacterium]